MFRVNSSLSASVLNNLAAVSALSAQSILRISSGLRINRPGDDPAGLMVSEKLGAVISALEQANRNAETAVSLTQTAETGLESIADIAVRLKELAVEAADTSISSSARSAIQDEAAQLLEEVDRIAASTSFNGQSLLATTQTFTFFIGEGSAGVNDTINLTLPASDTSQFFAGITSASIATSANSAALASLDLSIDSISLQRTNIGAVQNRLEGIIEDIGSKTVALQSAQSAIRDADIALEAANLVRAQILTQTNVFALTQSNLLAASVLSLLTTNTAA